MFFCADFFLFLFLLLLLFLPLIFKLEIHAQNLFSFLIKYTDGYYSRILSLITNSNSTNTKGPDNPEYLCWLTGSDRTGPILALEYLYIFFMHHYFVCGIFVLYAYLFFHFYSIYQACGTQNTTTSHQI